MGFQFEPIAEENLFQDFCKDLFNILHDTHSFQLYKSKGASQNGIDILSSDLMTVIQCKKKKLLRSDSTLENELLADLNDSISLTQSLPFKFDTFYLLTTTKKYSKVQNHAIKLTEENNFEVIFWGWEDIELYISRFEQLRKLYYPHLWSPNIELPHVLTYIPRIDGKAIIGREEDLFHLEELIKDSRKILLVNGLGGIGKSTLAKVYVHLHHENYSHIVWIDIQDYNTDSSDPNTLLMEGFCNNYSLIKNLGLSFNDSETLTSKFQLILNKLQNIRSETLLVVDNCPREIQNHLEHLPSSSNWKILLTSRTKIESFISLNLDVLNNIDAHKLFYYHYLLEKNDRITEILEIIGHHTLTIELLAKTANKRRIKISELYETLLTHGLKLSKQAKITVDHQPIKTPVYIFEYLLGIFSLANLGEAYLKILRFFSVLPSQNLSYEELKLIFHIGDNDNSFFEILDDLAQGGWISENTGIYQIHQVLQEVLREKLKPDFTTCIELIDGLNKCIQLDYKESFVTKLQYISIIDSVVQHIDSNDKKIILLINNVATLHDHNGNSNSAIKHYERILSLLGPEITEDNNYVYINLAVANLKIGNYEKALKYNLKNINFLEARDEKKHNMPLAMSYNNAAENFRHIGNLERALEYNFKAVKILESNEEMQYKPELATVYNNVSNSYGSLGDYKVSLKYGLKATNIRERMLNDEHPLLAQSYNNLGVDYEKLGRLETSLQYHRKAIAIREKIYTEDHYDLAESYNNMAELLRAMGQISESLLYHQKSIRIREKVLPANHPEIAMAYGNISASYLMMKDIKTGREYLEKAIRIRESQDSPTHAALGNLYLNYAVLLYLAKTLPEARKYLDSSLSIYKQTLNKEHPNYVAAIQFSDTLNKADPRPSYTVPSPKLSRNEPCYCGSGKKYKNCCQNS